MQKAAKWDNINFYIFQTHPWIFRDSSNPNEKLVIKKHQVKSDFFECSDFLADLESTAEFNSDQHNSLLNGKSPICVLIQLPVEDLRQLALRTVRKQLPRKEDCFQQGPLGKEASEKNFSQMMNPLPEQLIAEHIKKKTPLQKVMPI